MYDQLRNELTHELTLRRIDCTTINIVLGTLDQLMSKYDVASKCTDLVPYENCIPDSLNYYLASKAVEGQSELTLKSKRRHLVKFFERVRKKPEDIIANDIRAYLFQYKQERQVSDRSLDTLRLLIGSFFSWLALEEYIPKNPCAKISQIKFEKKHREAVTQLELEYLRKSCVTLKERCFLEILYSTGCRISELLDMKRSDVNLREAKVLLHGKGKKERVSYLNAKALIAYQEYMASRTDNFEYVIISDKNLKDNPDGHVSRSSGERIMKRIVDRAKKTYSFTHSVTAHVIRHATAQTMLDRGAGIHEVSALLGHSHIQTTEHYIQINSNSVQNSHTRTII